MKRDRTVADVSPNTQSILVVKDSDDDGAIAPAILKYVLNVERLEQDIKIGKLFPNSIALIR